MYHGSIFRVEKPLLDYSKKQKDFGEGFYLTTNFKQAKNYAEMQMRRKKANKGYINTYKMEDFKNLEAKEFIKADLEWFKFIYHNREDDREDEYTPRWDAVIGKIADDNIRKNLDGNIGRWRIMMEDFDREDIYTLLEDIYTLLETDNLKNQICLCTKKAIDKLKFVKVEELQLQENKKDVNRMDSIERVLIIQKLVKVNTRMIEKFGKDSQFWIKNIQDTEVYRQILDVKTKMYLEGTIYLCDCLEEELTQRGVLNV